MRKTLLIGWFIAWCAAGCTPPAPRYDLVIRGGTVYSGTGAAGTIEDLAIDGDRIAARGNLGNDRGRQEVNATGLAVAPGFINMLSHSETSLIADGRSLGDLHQGVTLEVFGESSMGVNGTRVLEEGHHTGAMPGRVVRGPGWKAGPR